MTTPSDARISQSLSVRCSIRRSVLFSLAASRSLTLAVVALAIAPAVAHAQFMQYAFIPGDLNDTVSRVVVPNMVQPAGGAFASGDYPRSVAVSPDGQRVYVANHGNASINVTVHDAITGTQARRAASPSSRTTRVPISRSCSVARRRS